MDYGGQYTHLIARRCRELGVFAEIVAQDVELENVADDGIRGIILSGGPRTVTENDLGKTFQSNLRYISRHNIKLLGICFGHQLLAVHFGSEIERGENPEYGQTEVSIINQKTIFNGLERIESVWMSHRDQIKQLPDGIIPLALSGNNRISAYSNQEGTIFGVQFHPEVTHTKNGIIILKSFLRDICGYQDSWRPENQIREIIKQVQTSVGDGQVLMATSGGVDSTVAAYLIREAIGSRLFCVFVDNGLLRQGEREEVEKAFKKMNFEHFITVDASDEFLKALEGIEDPEDKRKVIANKFIEVFEQKSKELESRYGHFHFLGQGTIYPDRVESAVTGKATAIIKSHHNVRLPDWMKLDLVEPLKDLYKDEVRQVGKKIGIPKHMLNRQPFPGPSLAIRISGSVTKEQLAILRAADFILQDTIKKEEFYSSIWQSFCILLPVKTVGVMGDERSYEQAVVLRIVESCDAMTASVSTPPWHILLKVASRIANEVRGINRVVYDLTSKPPATIEWY